MPQPRKATRFGGSPGHHNLMMSGLATELIRHGRIRTTLAKAKTVQPLAEKMITHAKKGDVHSRRQVLKVIRDRDVVHKLFAQVGPAFAERDGGYTRVLKLGPRKGDSAPMALIELVEGVSLEGAGELEEAPRRRWALRRRKGGTVSSSAREREEERLAAVDRGEEFEPEFEPDFEPSEDTSAADEGAPADEEPAEPGAEEPERGEAVPVEAGEAEETPQADPAEVEARLAAEDEAGAQGEGQQEAQGQDGQDQDGQDQEAQDQEGQDQEGQEQGDDEGPITDAPVPSDEQEAPSPETMPTDDEQR